MRPYCLGVSSLLLGDLPVERFRGVHAKGASTCTGWSDPGQSVRNLLLLPPTVQISLKPCTPMVHLWYMIQGSLVPRTPMRDMLCLGGDSQAPQARLQSGAPHLKATAQTCEVGESPVFL